MSEQSHRLAISLTGLLLLALMVGCATPVKTEYDRDVAFEQYQRFAWQAPKREEVRDPEFDSELMDRRVARIVTRTLEEAGYEAVSREDADFLVTYHTATRPAARRSGSSFSVGMGGGNVGGGVTLGSSRPQMHSTVMIDVIDAGEGQLVWRGWQDSENRQDRFDDNRLTRLINKLLKEFPPQ